MKTPANAFQPTAPESKPRSKPGAKDNLKSLPMPELQAELGSSPDGLRQAEAEKRLTQYGSNEIEEKETNPFPDFVKAAVAVHGKSARNGDPRDHQGKVGQSGTLRNWTTKS
jgi:hypothetical protein